MRAFYIVMLALWGSFLALFPMAMGALAVTFVTMRWCPVCDRIAVVGLVSFFSLCALTLGKMHLEQLPSIDDATPENSDRPESDTWDGLPATVYYPRIAHPRDVSADAPV